MELLYDKWESSDGWTVLTDTDSLNEANKASKSKSVIGVVRGAFFFPDGTSANERFYPRDLWERVLQNPGIKKRLENRTMFGKIGHDDRPCTDEDLEKGRVSHIISNLHIGANGVGMGEALILNTEMGRNLLTYMDAGAKIKISSRASGGFKEGATHKGMPIVDPLAYILETFDFVLNAGFANTNPVLAESAKTKTTRKMEDQILQRLLENRDSSQTQLAESLNRLDEALNENVRLQHELNQLMEETEGYRQYVSLGEAIANAFGQSDLDNLAEILNESDMGAVRAIMESGISEDEVLGYFELGSASEISEAVDAAIAALEDYRAIGSPQEIAETLEMADEALEQYLQFGSVSEVEERMGELDEMEEEIQENWVADLAERKSREFGVDVAIVERLAGRCEDEEELDEILSSLGDEDDDDDYETNEVLSRGSALSNSTASVRLFESLRPASGNN